ncbi:MAG TPA: D-galactonate dehydratase family protein [Steroidobacteraceae bacterium]
MLRLKKMSQTQPLGTDGSIRDRRIISARVIITCPGRNFVTLKVETQSGVYGLGDATLNGRELAVAAYLQEHVAPNLIGRDAERIEDTWQFLYRGAYWRRGPVTMTAIAAVDVALWDILAKLANLPLYQMLGGRSREGALVYGHANGESLAETSDEVGRYFEMGYLAVRAQSGVPGLQKTYGVSSEKHAYEPAESPRPMETVWSTPQYLRTAPELFERLRSDHGPQIELLHDVHHRLTPIEAARLARDLEPFRLFWLEDATPAENQANFAMIRRHSVTPLAIGEVFIQEYMHHSAETLVVFPHDYVFRGGRLFCGESAGHGVNIDETLAARYPYSPKQLPIARLEDGTMWDW